MRLPLLLSRSRPGSSVGGCGMYAEGNGRDGNLTACHFAKTIPTKGSQLTPLPSTQRMLYQPTHYAGNRSLKLLAGVDSPTSTETTGSDHHWDHWFGWSRASWEHLERSPCNGSHAPLANVWSRNYKQTWSNMKVHFLDFSPHGGFDKI